MPKFVNQKVINENLSIGVQYGAGANPTGYWHAIIRLPGLEPKTKTTKVKYEADSGISYSLAKDKALEIFLPHQLRWARGSSVSDIWTIKRVGDQYLEENYPKAMENDALVASGLAAKHPVLEGRGYWSKMRWDLDLGKWNNHLIKFFEDVEAQEGHTLLIDEWNDRLLLRFTEWYKTNRSEHAPATVGHWKQLAQRIFVYALHKGHIDTLPRLPSVEQGGMTLLRRRMRRTLTVEEYDLIRHEFQRRLADPGRYGIRWMDQVFLCYMFVLVCAGSGVRPPTGKVRHTIIEWEDVFIDDEYEDYPLLRRKNEKGHTYTAMLMPEAAWALREVRRFYRHKGIECSTGPVFRHTTDRHSPGRRSQWKAGDPIVTFHFFFKRLVRDLGLRGGNGIQAENVSLSSLRSFYITQRLAENPDVRIEELSEITGVTPEHIRLRYYRFAHKDKYKEFAKSMLDRATKAPVRKKRNEDGYDFPIGWD